MRCGQTKWCNMRAIHHCLAKAVNSLSRIRFANPLSVILCVSCPPSHINRLVTSELYTRIQNIVALFIISHCKVTSPHQILQSTFGGLVGDLR